MNSLQDLKDTGKLRHAADDVTNYTAAQQASDLW